MTYKKETEVVGTLFPRDRYGDAFAHILDGLNEHEMEDLMPKEAQFKKGRFRIVVEFTPDEPGV